MAVLLTAPVRGQTAAQTPAAPLLPNGVAYDTAGNLYFADTNRNQVYESTLAGELVVVAGNGVQGYGGDGGPATSAQLNAPQGIAIDPDGTLYIADTGNQRIRVVAGGQIATFAGTGIAGFSGDGGAASAASFNRPTALAVDNSGALLVCDSGNERVRRISAGVIATIAGSGVQGFAGDGGAAMSARMDTPSGVAVSPDGRIFVADSHNQRIRVIATDGTISTFAGTGHAGYSGDGGAATAAEISLPRGIVVTAAGAVVFADSNNQRIRQVNAQGIISTLAGSGLQGWASDGSAAVTAQLNSPHGVAVNGSGLPVFADAPNHEVREMAANGDLYLPAGMATPPRTSAAALALPPNAVYGGGSAAVSVTGSAGTPQGVVQVVSNGGVVTQGALNAGAATLALASLPVGNYTLKADYLGDGINPAASSVAANLNVTPAPLTVTANAQTVEYGQTIPALTGSSTGVLVQDSGSVTAIFSTTATALSPPGTYPITAALTGLASPDYSVAMAAGSGSLEVTPAVVNVTERPLAQSSYAGLPLLLSVQVASTTRGTPTGTVTFLDGTTPVATAPLVGGVASATYLSPLAGSHSIVAAYSGDTDFNAGLSASITTVVGGMPDYTIGFAGSATQTVVASLAATYQITVAAQPGPFTGAVSMSANGLPAGATASFSPPQVVPGTSSVAVTLSVQTSATMASAVPFDSRPSIGGRQGWIAFWALVLPCLLLGSRRRAMQAALCGLLLLGAAGCGARSVSDGSIHSQTYSFIVSATSTNLAGALVVHSLPATLVVQ